jgi:hypothetical protein
MREFFTDASDGIDGSHCSILRFWRQNFVENNLHGLALVCQHHGHGDSLQFEIEHNVEGRKIISEPNATIHHRRREQCVLAI